MKTLNISTRLTLLIGGLSLLLAGLGGFGLYSLAESNASLQTVYVDGLMPAAQLAQVKELTMRNQQLLLESMLDKAPKAIPVRLAELDANVEMVGKIWAAYMDTHLTPEEKILARDFAEARKTFVAEALTPTKLALAAGNIDEARRIAMEVWPAKYAPVSTGIAALGKLQVGVGRQEYEASLTRYAQARITTLGSITLAIFLAGFFGWRLTRSIVLALGAEPAAVKEVADAVAAGNLARPISLRAGDHVSVMAAMKRMSDSLSATVDNVRQSAEGIATASAQIAAGNNELSSRTEEQASALEETAASMEELSATVKHNADNSRQANQLARGAADVATRGGVVVGRVVETMKGINESSRKIADIISVIDGIAFQTNILALNAAVEAARAGDQGRGFAVVATEVRNLAQRSAQAAKEIKTLITASVERVGEGSALVDQAGSTMGEVVQSIQRVTDIMDEISSASIEQSAGVAQINEAVSQMDQVTQQNAALVEESAAAAESLKHQAGSLVGAVAVFQLGGSEGRVASADFAPATQSDRATAAKPAAAWADVERRGPNRAKHVLRPNFGTAAPSTPPPRGRETATGKANGTDGSWTSF